jgi:ATP-dependent DNA helicase DinG
MKNIKLDYDPRSQQIEILDFVKDSIDKDKKFMMIDAPTGVGKSYAAVMIADWYSKEVNVDAKFDIITNTKLLQDQYTADFSFMASLKGSGSYWCRSNMMNCGESKMLNKVKGKRCGTCSHSIAQSQFTRERIGLTNYHLLTAYTMYAPDKLAERGANVLIIDEAHSFEEAFCDFIASTFSERSLTNLGIWEDWMTSDLNDITEIRGLSTYVSKIIIPRLSKHMTELIDDAKETRGNKKRAELVNKADHCDKSLCKYARFINDEKNYGHNWVFEKELDQDGNTKISVEPIWGNAYMKEMFFSKYDHIIMMSGTILNPDMMAFLMGLDDNEYTYLELPCPFEAKKRPIIYVKFGKMSYYDKQETFKTAIPVIKKILEKNKDHKGIIHSGNYQFSDWIRRNIKDDRLLIHDSSTREKSLKHHLESEFDTVLVSPSMMNGIDLKDELSRFQIIVKIPFPNLGSMKTKRRLETKPEWYNWKTLIEVMQSYGRSVRSDDDWAETYILDSCFDQIMQKRMPQYFRDAIIIKRLNK